MEGFGEDVRHSLCKGSVCKGLATSLAASSLRDAFSGGSLGEVTKFRTKHHSQAKLLLFSRLYCASPYILDNNKTSDLSIEGFVLNFVGMAELATSLAASSLRDAFPLRSPRGPLQTISGFELRSSRALTIENKI